MKIDLMLTQFEILVCTSYKTYTSACALLFLIVNLFKIDCMMPHELSSLDL